MLLFFFWMNLNEWITVLSCYTCFLLDSIRDGQYSYCVRSIPCLLSYNRLYYIENSHQQDNSWCVYIHTANALKRLRKLQLCLSYHISRVFYAFMDNNWTATAKTCIRWFVTIKAQTSLRIRAVSSATLLSAFLDESYLHLPREKFQFLAGLFSRRVWFQTRFVGNPRRQIFSLRGLCCLLDSSRAHITSATDNNFKKIMRRLFIRYINGSHIIWLRSASSNTQVIRNYGPGGDFDFLAAGPWYDPVLTAQMSGWGVVT